MKNVVIIAEAGVNHNGNLDLAKALVEAAAYAGADFVKFQTFNSDKVVTKGAQKALYQKQNSQGSGSQYEMIRKLELSKSMHLEIIDHCKIHGIRFLSTGFDLESLYFLNELSIPLFKIPSGEITNLPYLRTVASFKKPVIMSTGMSNMNEIHQAVEVLLKGGISKSEITILHCNTEYPTPYEDVNLRAMNKIGEAFNVSVGYSDHTLGIEVPIAAVACGAEVIEKHFTLDRNAEGPDHKASLEPQELKKMVIAIRNIEKAMSGNGTKEPSLSEIKNISIARKSIVAGRFIRKGEVFSPDNLATKRPGLGMSPMEWDSLLGKSASKDYYVDDFIEE